MLRLHAICLCLLMAIPASARADDSVNLPVLRIGMVESHPAMADPLKIRSIEDAYERALDIPVEIIRFPDLAALVDAHASARIEYAMHTALSFATTAGICDCVVPLRRPVGLDGVEGFRAALLLKTGIEAKSARIAYSSRSSLSGWILPNEAMVSGALEIGETIEAGSTGKAIATLASGEVDGVIAWLPIGRDDSNDPLPARVFGGDYASGLEAVGDLRVAWLSDPVYHGPHAVLRSLPVDLVEKLDIFLDALPQGRPALFDVLEPYQSGGYKPATGMDYQALERLAMGLRESVPAGAGSQP